MKKIQLFVCGLLTMVLCGIFVGCSGGGESLSEGEQPTPEDVVSVEADETPVPSGSVDEFADVLVRQQDFNMQINDWACMGDDGWIYFRGGEPDKYTLSKMRPDGSDLTIIERNANPWFPQVENGWVYYSYAQGVVRRVRTNGQDSSVLAHEASTFINVQDGWVYYAAGDNTIHRMASDGSDNQVLARGTGCHVQGDWIYFLAIEDNQYRLSRMRLDGSSVETLEESPSQVYHYAMTDEYLYRGNVRMNLDGSGAETGYSIPYGDVALVGDWAYTFSRTWLGRFPVEDARKDEQENLIEIYYNPSGCNVVGDWVFFFDLTWRGMYKLHLTDGALTAANG